MTQRRCRALDSTRHRALIIVPFPNVTCRHSLPRIMTPRHRRSLSSSTLNFRRWVATRSSSLPLIRYTHSRAAAKLNCLLYTTTPSCFTTSTPSLLHDVKRWLLVSSIYFQSRFSSCRLTLFFLTLQRLGITGDRWYPSLLDYQYVLIRL
jgi:hypothetical protein